MKSFLFRVESQAREGGFALLSGIPGTGKSSVLRILEDHLCRIPDRKVGVLTRPQTNAADLYRELGDLFGVELTPHNRWAGTKVLRKKWATFMETALFRPVLLVDEAQAMMPLVMNELKLLMSTDLDSRQLLLVVLAGDQRILKKLEHEDLLPIASRIRVRLLLKDTPSEELSRILRHLLAQAGNPALMTGDLVESLADHARGNLRDLMTMAADLLFAAAEQERDQIDVKLFLERFDPVPSRRKKGGGA
jgi:type II secretory pathway predicted ATPase ExeA